MRDDRWLSHVRNSTLCLLSCQGPRMPAHICTLALLAGVALDIITLFCMGLGIPPVCGMHCMILHATNAFSWLLFSPLPSFLSPYLLVPFSTFLSATPCPPPSPSQLPRIPLSTLLLSLPPLIFSLSFLLSTSLVLPFSLSS